MSTEELYEPPFSDPYARRNTQGSARDLIEVLLMGRGKMVLKPCTKAIDKKKVRFCVRGQNDGTCSCEATMRIQRFCTVYALVISKLMINN